MGFRTPLIIGGSMSWNKTETMGARLDWLYERSFGDCTSRLVGAHRAYIGPGMMKRAPIWSWDCYVASQCSGKMVESIGESTRFNWLQGKLVKASYIDAQSKY